MATKVASESRKAHANGNEQAGNGHAGNGDWATDMKSAREPAARAGLRKTIWRWCSTRSARLVDAAKDGRLTERSKATQFNGIQREMLQGMNELLDAILVPLGESTRILAQVAEGKIDELITQNYKGDHERMKQGINSIAVACSCCKRRCRA